MGDFVFAFQSAIKFADFSKCLCFEQMKSEIHRKPLALVDMWMLPKNQNSVFENYFKIKFFRRLHFLAFDILLSQIKSTFPNSISNDISRQTPRVN